VVGRDELDDNEEEKEPDRAVDDPWEECEGEGIAIRTATLIVVGEEGSTVDIAVGWVLAVSREVDEAGRGEVGKGVGFKNVLARLNKEGVVETSVVR
jgi:hypothetical protein